jgi:predicted glycosyltransferase
MPEEMLKICGAFRYDNIAGYIQAKPFKEALRRKYGLPQEAQIIMVFSGVNVSESVDMLQNITLALQESHKSIRILFKSHPLKIIDHEAQKIIEKAGIHGSIVSVDANYLDYIALSDVTCFCNSTIGLESIALGTHAISFDNIHSMCSFDMIEAKGAVLHVRSLSDLKEAFNKVFDGDRHLKEIEGLWTPVIYETFYLLDGNAHARVCKFLENDSKHLNSHEI